jgi:hypothetical protein
MVATSARRGARTPDGLHCFLDELDQPAAADRLKGTASRRTNTGATEAFGGVGIGDA